MSSFNKVSKFDHYRHVRVAAAHQYQMLSHASLLMPFNRLLRHHYFAAFGNSFNYGVHIGYFTNFEFFFQSEIVKARPTAEYLNSRAL